MDLTIDGLAPTRAEHPETAEDLAAAIGAAAAAREAVVLWGGGTRIGVGSPPARYDAAIDLSGLRGLVDHSPADLVCTVRAGTTLAELADALAPSRQRWPIEVADPDRATVGGTIASAAPSPSRIRFQHVRDWIIGCTAVLGDGTVARAGGRVVKNVTGYDLTRLYSGSYGTLAALAEVSLKLVATDEDSVTLSTRDGDATRLRTLALRLRALPLDAIVLVRDSDTLLVRIAGAVATVARLRRDVEASASFAEVPADAIAGVMREIERAPRCARLATAPGHEADELAAGLVAFIGAGVAYVRGDLAALRERRVAIENAGGALVLERGSVEDKRALGVWGTPRIPAAIARGLRSRFDPRDVLAPGRMPA